MLLHPTFFLKKVWLNLPILGPPLSLGRDVGKVMSLSFLTLAFTFFIESHTGSYGNKVIAEQSSGYSICS